MYRRNLHRNALDRVVDSEMGLAAQGNLSALITRGKKLDPPGETEKGGRDWRDSNIPNNLLCFLCEQEDHSLRTWNPLSTRAGKFHQFDRHCLIVALEGDGILGVEKNSLLLKEGEAFLIEPHHKHYYLRAQKNFSWLYVMFEMSSSVGEMQRDFAKESRKVSRKARRLLNQILESYSTESEPRETFELCLAVKDLIGVLSEAKGFQHEVGELSLAEKVKAAVFAHADDLFTIEQLAQAMGMAPTQLKDEYKRSTGEPLGVFVRAVRLTRAASLLRNGEGTVEAVAKSCGFREMEQFNDAFEAQYRVKPDAYTASNRS